MKTIGDQTGDDIDEGVDWTAMTSVFNLRNVFELIYHTFNNGSLAQEQLVNHRDQSVFHVLLDACDGLDIEGVQ